MKIAVMGFGTVGSGVVELFEEHNKTISEKTPEKLEIGYILDIRDFPGNKYEHLLTKDVNDILNDKEVAIVVETMGGLKPAFDFVSSALKNGKSVVTSNKELVATKGFELMEIAKENNLNFLFEAAVGGGIPVIHPMMNCLTANKIISIDGILNGTTNFILNKMITDGESFDDALSEAQKMGYAEKDPTADIEGLDAGRKLAILTSIASGIHVLPGQISTTGITSITLEDVSVADKAGFVIKLIASARLDENNKYTCVVSPALVSKSNPLSAVNSVMNAVVITGDAVGDVMFYGPGAGKIQTASAVVSDVVECARFADKDISEHWSANDESCVNSSSEFMAKFYIACEDTPAIPCCKIDGENAYITNDKYTFDEIYSLTKDSSVRNIMRIL